MTQLHTLTVRTNAALGRLADLQRRAEQISTATTPVIRPALKELSSALEELQVANEQLQSQIEELVTARTRADELSRRMDEFLQIVPIACLWTDPAGVILEANESAAVLLNVARPRLPGKPLMLFVADRQPFFDVLTALKAPGGGAAEIETLVRPRERKPRAARLTARVLAHDTRWCWFISPAAEVDVLLPLPE